MSKNLIMDSQELDQVRQKLSAFREIILSNLVMISEIPAPTFGEGPRGEWLINRFSELELMNCSHDEAGNGVGIIPGLSGDKNILVVAHLDTLFPESVDHTVSLYADRAKGPGVGNNGLGLAVLAALPQLLRYLELEFQSNIILMGSARSLGHGDIAGLRFFLKNFKNPIHAGICLEGVRLGRLSNSSLGVLRGRITCSIPEEYDWTRFDSVGAIVIMNEIISRLLEIPLPRKPKTTIVLGSIEGGNSYDTITTKAILRFEIRSESDEIVETISRNIRFLSEEITSRTGAIVTFNEVARRKFGGTPFSHPLNITARNILEELGIKSRLTPSASELSAFIDNGIPALTIGLTHGENMGDVDETILLSPMEKGLAQLIALLKAIDEGVIQ